MTTRETILVQYMNGVNVKKAAATLSLSEDEVIRVYEGMDQAEMDKASQKMTKLLYTGFAYARSIGAGHLAPRGAYAARAIGFASEISVSYTKNEIVYPNIYKMMQDRNLTVRDLAKMAGVKDAIANKVLRGGCKVNLDWAHKCSPQTAEVIRVVLDVSGKSFEEMFLRDMRKPYIHSITNKPLQQEIVYPKVKDWFEKNRISTMGIAWRAGVSGETVSRVLAGTSEVKKNVLELRGRKSAVARVVRTILQLSGLDYDSAFGCECDRVHKMNEPALRRMAAKRAVANRMTPLFGRIIRLRGNEHLLTQEANNYRTFEVRIFDNLELFTGACETLVANQADAMKAFKKVLGSPVLSAQLLGIDHKGERHSLAFYGVDGTQEAKISIH